MRIYMTIIISLFFPLLLSGAEWDSLDVKVINSSPSIEKDSTQYFLKDSKDRSFEVNYSAEPGEQAMKRVIELKNLFFGWGRISTGRMEFYFSSDGIYANLQTSKISYKEENLLPYLPAGLSFQDKNDGLHYRFRIVVDNKSYMLDGIYIDEETFLKEIYNFIRIKDSKEQLTVIKEQKIKEEDKLKKVQHRLSVALDINYMIPTGKWSAIFSGGYGFMAGVTLNNTGISLNDKTLFHLDFTLLIGYHRLMVNDTLAPEITTSLIKSAYILPICLYSRYNFNIINLFFISLKVGVGLNFNSIDYSELQSSGTYTPVEIREWAPSISLGVQFGFPLIKDKILLLAGAEYKWMFERYMIADSVQFQLGLEYSFMIFGK
jgi:hypothetical protein